MKQFNGFVILILISISVQIQSRQFFDKCTSESITDDQRIVQTNDGPIKGECYNVPVTYSNNKTIDYSIFSWLSIRYAEAPTGKNRFMKPVPANKWSEIKNATEWPKSCPQNSRDFAFTELAEDCLFLNIFVRNDTYFKKELKPIMVWIHGGAFNYGSSSYALWEPSTLVAAGDVIVASINYRLGIFGFLHMSGTDATGNVAILDQSLALKWIYDNADKFGGDRNKITIFGESAGAWSVGYHLFYEPSWQYFRNAIMQSGAPGGLNNENRVITSDRATQLANQTVSSICPQSNNVDKLTCLQSATLEKLTAISDRINNVVLDNIVIKQTIEEMMSEGKYKKCNIISGFNSAEAGFLIDYDPRLSFPLNYTAFKLYIEEYPFNKMVQSTPELRKLIYQEYLNSSELINSSLIDYSDLFIRVWSNRMFNCPTFLVSEEYSKIGRKAYVYEDDFISEFSPHKDLGVIHAEDVPYVFGEALSNKDKEANKEVPDFTHSTEIRKFTEKIITYWTNFAKYDDPSYSNHSAEIEEWKPFVPENIDINTMTAAEKMDTGRYLWFQNKKIKMSIGFSEYKCDFWNFTLDATSNANTAFFNICLVAVANIFSLMFYLN